MYCVVMALAERNLYVALKQDVVGQNMDTVRYVFTQLVRDVDHMHSKGMLHADIKPLNIVRMGGKWLLIDLDAACHMHEEVRRPLDYQPSHQFRFLHLSVSFDLPLLPPLWNLQAIGQKALSTAFSPPESVGVTASGEVYVKRGHQMEIMGRRDDAAAGDNEGKDSHPVGPVGGVGAVVDLAPADVCVAQPSFDVWSLAAVLYQVTSPRTPPPAPFPWLWQSHVQYSCFLAHPRPRPPHTLSTPFCGPL
jgi:serine/threonine protein kinase